MKRTTKTFLATALALTMAAALAGCGGSSASSSSSGSESASEAGESAAIKIGGSGPLTGGAAVYGNAVKNAAEIAVEEVNAQGGVQFELDFEDDEHNGEKAVTAYGVLKDWGMQLSLGCVTSTPGAAVSPYYQQDGIFALTPSGSSPAVTFSDADNMTGAFGNVFQMCFSDPNQGTASADYIADHPEMGTKIAIIYKNDDNYSKGIRNKFVEEAAVKGLEVVNEGTFDDSNAQDFNVQLTQAQAEGAEVVFLPIYYDPASLILTQANSMGYSPVFFGVDGMDGILTLEGFDTSLAEGVYLLTPFSADATDDLTVNFVKKYQEKCGGEIPNQFAADAYDCIYAIKQACEAAGVTPDMSAAEISEKVIEQFKTMTFSGLTGSDMTWNENGEVTKLPKAVVIQNGAYVGVEE
ncbi:MAG: ABC transporter substrate-binding protein [Eubacteriales bacterium]|nr:ABC transporter substrate-binding protein [Eubacteriales bacterium]